MAPSRLRRRLPRLKKRNLHAARRFGDVGGGHGTVFVAAMVNPGWQTVPGDKLEPSPRVPGWQTVPGVS